MPKLERCAGCGIESPQHPIVGITKPLTEMKDYQLDIKPSARGFVAYGVCDVCWRQPEHRVRPLKMTFFLRAHLAKGLAAAGSNVVKLGE